MITVDQQVRSASDAITSNIESLQHDRALLAQNILSQLRNLVEGMAVGLHNGGLSHEFTYPAVKPAVITIAGNGKLSFIARFHKLLQISASHYTLGGDPSERLMLKYFDYLRRIRDVASKEFGLQILGNLEKFPIDLDPSLQEYHQKIALQIEASRTRTLVDPRKKRYYIHAVRPFFTNGKIYYEVTFFSAVDNVGKFDRIIGFTDLDVTDKYAAYLVTMPSEINVLGRSMPLTIIKEWEVSIRPCEIKNFARILGMNGKTSVGSTEYQRLMQYLTSTMSNLLDIVDMQETQYDAVRSWATQLTREPRIFPVIDAARATILAGSGGANVLRYLMLRMSNRLIKVQYNNDQCSALSNMNLKYGCIPFDRMPFCTSLPSHNPRISDLMESLDAAGRNHELLARRIKTNVEDKGVLYTPLSDVINFGDVNSLAMSYNNSLYYKHTARQILQDMGHLFVRGYEDDTAQIIEELQKYAASGISGYQSAVNLWLTTVTPSPDDPMKVLALENLFADSHVALVYGAAGTGKSTMVDLLAKYFNTNSKLFLAHTNPAIDNLKRRVNAQSSTFRTIRSHVNRFDGTEYDVLVIDECSTVSNSDLLAVLTGTKFKLLVLVGDVYQIESIQFGNWFALARSFIPKSAVFELVTPFRAKNAELLDLWSAVRESKDNVLETLARNKYSSVLNSDLFAPQQDDEIILCLNYDGLYGINNVNRFLQSANPGAATVWESSTYKVGDPVLFNETDRFRPVIFNNLKGKIIAIQRVADRVQFDVWLDRPVSAFDVDGFDLEYVTDSVVRFSVYEQGSGDDDDDSSSSSSIVPFQVAYAVSIHKAQGLEYDSVKVVITDANEDDVTHNIFYTAITRARQRLQIFWTPETENAVLAGLKHNVNKKDAALLVKRRGLTKMP